MVALRSSLLVILAALAAFGGSLAGTFAFDDHSLLVDPVLAASSGWWEVFAPLQTRPLAWLTFWMNRQVSDAPWLWHAVNLLLHTGAAWLVWDVLRRVLPRRAAFLAALVFAVHPAQAEAVNYVYARPIVLATLLCLPAFRAWLDGRMWTAAAWFAAGLLAKEEVAAFPLFLALFHWWRERERREWWPVAVMTALASGAGLRVIWAAARTPGSGAGPDAGMAWWQYLSTQGVVILRYLRLVLVPYGFSVDPDISVNTSWTAWAAWAGVTVVVAAALRKFRGAGFWVLAGLVLLLPSSSIFPAADLAADRRLYLPMFAFAAAAGLLAERLDRRVIAAAAVMLVALSAGRTFVWQTEQRLWAEAVERAPRKVRPKVQLAKVSPPEEAESLLLQAKELAPEDARVAGELGRLYLGMNRGGDALREFGRALALAPSDALNRNNRGVALAFLGETEAARQDFEGALQSDPCLFDARLNLKRLGVDAVWPSRCRLTPEQAQLLR